MGGDQDAFLARDVAGALSITRSARRGRRAGPDALSHSIRDMSGLKTVEADFLTHKARDVLFEFQNGEIAARGLVTHVRFIRLFDLLTSFK